LLLVRDFLVLEGLPCNSFVSQLLRERPAESCINCCSCSSVAGRHCVYCCYLLHPARNNDQPFPLLLFMLLCKKDFFLFPLHSFLYLLCSSCGYLWWLRFILCDLVSCSFALQCTSSS
jgi:hypothetical protein